MKKFLLLLLMTGTIVACEKNNDPQPGNPAITSGKVKKSTYNSGETIFTYDGSGRIKSRAYLNGSKAAFTYEPGKVYEKQYNTAGVLTMTYTYELDANGLVGKETRSDQPGFLETRLFNNDKQVVQFTALQNGNTNSGDYFYSKGNCDSIRHSHNGTWNTTIKLTYYEDKLNVLGNEEYGEPFWGKKSKHMLKSEQYFFSDGTVGGLETYTYEYDAKGRAIKKTVVEGADIYITYYSYE